MNRRPTHRELTNKLNTAKQHLVNKKWQALDYRVLREDCSELGLETYDEICQNLSLAIEKFTPDNYIGSKPPKRGVRGCIGNRELFEFSCYFEPLRQRIYCKFAVDDEQLFVVSFHREREHGAC